MKTVIFFLCLIVLGRGFALDNQGWLERAKKSLDAGSRLETDETQEDGLFCLATAAIDAKDGESSSVAIGKAELEAKRLLTAFIHGENMTAVRRVEKQAITHSIAGEKNRQVYSKFEKRITAKVDALVRGIKMVGQVTVESHTYVVCVTCERFEDDSTILKAAQAEYGEEGVVKSVGEASSFELAKQKAIRGAVEQVLGTVVVGYDKVSLKSEFQSKIFSGADGVVEKYRILSEKDIPAGKRVEIVAKVSKKTLLDNYSTYMKFLGNPAFYIESNSSDLNSHFTEFFTDMGIRVASDPNQASFVIHCVGDFRPLKHPANGRDGIQLSLRFKISEINGSEILVDMKNNPRKSACFIGRDAERQKEICSEKAFAQMKAPLHQKIQAMVAKLVGRKMDAEANDE
jgi:hypothetical protein